MENEKYPMCHLYAQKELKPLWVSALFELEKYIGHIARDILHIASDIGQIKSYIKHIEPDI